MLPASWLCCHIVQIVVWSWVVLVLCGLLVGVVGVVGVVG